MTGVDREEVLARIHMLLLEVWDERPAEGTVDSDESLLSLGVDSLTLVILLDRVEREFHVVWDPADPPGAYSSLQSIANAASPVASDGTAATEG
jgi:clorobiocin biosynthesis protein CloN1